AAGFHHQPRLAHPRDGGLVEAHLSQDFAAVLPQRRWWQVELGLHAGEVPVLAEQFETAIYGMFIAMHQPETAGLDIVEEGGLCGAGAYRNRVDLAAAAERDRIGERLAGEMALERLDRRGRTALQQPLEV